MTVPDEDLLPTQLDAVTHRGGPLVIRGAAGTGKTTVLLRRFHSLVAEGCRPERIAVLTPSASRSDALRSWLQDELEQGYEELFVLEPHGLAALLVNASGSGREARDAVLDASERFAMLLERIDELSLQSHDFGGSARALLAGFIRRIDRLKAHLVDAEQFAAWAAGLAADARPDGIAAEAALEREFAEVYRAHERMLAEAGMGDAGYLVREALRLVGERPGLAGRFEHVLVDDIHELDPADVELARLAGGDGLAMAVDPVRAALAVPGARMIELTHSLRCPEQVLRAAAAVTPLSRCR